MARVTRIDQFCAGFSLGDAISNEALILKERLRALGYESEIYCQHFSDRDADLVQHYRRFHNRRDALLIYHHSFYSDFLERIDQVRARMALIHHNTTPPEFVAPYSSEVARRLALTRERLAGLTDRFELHLADSQYNAQDLQSYGFRDVQVMPVPVDFERLGERTRPARLEFLEDGTINILFVGRIFPNKRHQDIIKTYSLFRKFVPRSRLILVGDFHPQLRAYSGELLNLARELGVADSVYFPGMVSSDDVRAYFSRAHVFLSMSEHEGFFVPLIESMHFRLPILAFDCTVIPETLGESGVLFREKDLPRVAAMMAELTENESLRRAVLDRQSARLGQFRLERTLQAFDEALARLGITGIQGIRPDAGPIARR